MYENSPPQPIAVTEHTPSELVDRIARLIDGEYTFEEIDGTFELDSDGLRLSFTQEEDIFEIRNIEALQEGLGSKVMSQIHGYANKYKMTVIASNVRDTARGFWQKMGYEESGHPGEFIRN